QFVFKHKLNDAVNSTSTKSKKALIYDTSEHRQEAVLDIGLENLEKIYEKCKEYGKEMPTEIKLDYNVKQNSLKGKYRYGICQVFVGRVITSIFPALYFCTLSGYRAVAW